MVNVKCKYQVMILTFLKLIVQLMYHVDRTKKMSKSSLTHYNALCK